MGKLDSVEAINKARNDLRDDLNNKYQNVIVKNYDLAKFAYDKAEKTYDAYTKSKQFSQDFTNTKNDDFIYSANGSPMTDSLGQPIRRNKTKEIKNVIDNKDGTQTVLYAGGKYEQIKAGQDQSKAVDEGVTKLLGPKTGFVYNSNGNIITGSDGQPIKYSAAQEYDYKPLQTVDANGNLVTTGYLAVNKSDPNDRMVLDAKGNPVSGGGTS